VGVFFFFFNSGIMQEAHQWCIAVTAIFKAAKHTDTGPVHSDFTDIRLLCPSVSTSNHTEHINETFLGWAGEMQGKRKMTLICSYQVLLLSPVFSRSPFCFPFSLSLPLWYIHQRVFIWCGLWEVLLAWISVTSLLPLSPLCVIYHAWPSINRSIKPLKQTHEK